jgi:hypothetical protein
MLGVSDRCMLGVSERRTSPSSLSSCTAGIAIGPLTDPVPVVGDAAAANGVVELAMVGAVEVTVSPENRDGPPAAPTDDTGDTGDTGEMGSLTPISSW